MKNVLFAALLLALPAFVSAQTIRFVRAGAGANGANGFSWQTAFPDLNQALAIAQHGDEIWVAAGMYKPTDGTDRYATFTLPNGVRLYGGFAGAETALEQRDWMANPTILSGDIGAPDDAADNSYTILYATQCDTTTRVDGLILEGGNANNPDFLNVFEHQRTRSGAAIYLDGEGPGQFAYLKLANCVLRHNNSGYFGAVFANGRDDGRCALEVENCQFHHNRSGASGGALAVQNYTPQIRPTILQNCRFADNSAVSGGGAVYLEHDQALTFTDCIFERDSILGGRGNAVMIAGTGLTFPWQFKNCYFGENAGANVEGTAIAVFAYSSSNNLSIENCDFYNNSNAFSQGGGAIAIENYNFGTNAVLSVLILQSIFRENQGAYSVFETVGEVEPRFLNCLFYHNAFKEFIGLDNPLTWSFVNCIIFKNNLSSINYTANGPAIQLDHCLTNRPDCAALGPGVNCGPGTLFGLDPQFADPVNGDFRLLPCSPALDAGSDAAADAIGLTVDFDGNPRVADAAVDLGPFENDRFVIPANIQHVTCAGAADGSAGFAANACAPFSFAWTNDAGQTGDSPNGLGPGLYQFTITDNNNFADSAEVEINAPAPLEVFVTTVPASSSAASDGAVLLDSVAGGTPPYPWPVGEPLAGLENLPPGTHTVTLTDAAGCPAVFSFEIGFVSGHNEIDNFLKINILPNPAPAGAAARLFFDGEKIAAVALHDALGRPLRQWENPARPEQELIAPPAAGWYFLTLRSESGRGRVLPWLVH